MESKLKIETKFKNCYKRNKHTRKSKLKSNKKQCILSFYETRKEKKKKRKPETKIADLD